MTPLKIEPPKDKYVPLWEKSIPFELDCDIVFGGAYIEVKLYDDSHRMLHEKAREIVQVPYFIMNQVIYKKPSLNLQVLDYFEVPYDEQPVGTYKGRVRIQLKWLVKTPQGYQVKPNILALYLLFKY